MMASRALTGRRAFPLHPSERREEHQHLSIPGFYEGQRVGSLQKDELIQMHTLLCQIKNHLQSTGVASGEAFAEYEDLGISPVHVHRSKGDHKRAIFLLGK